MSDLSGMWDKSDFIGGETDMEDKMREEFEAFGKRNGWNLNRRDMRGADGAYCNSTVESSWRSWQDCAAHYERQLAAAQADNVRLREALNDIASPNSNHEIFTNAPAGMTLDRMYEEIAQAALAQPLDTSALDAYVSKLTAWQPIETAPKEPAYIIKLGRIIEGPGKAEAWLTSDSPRRS